jgi:Fungal specific transcription factor domain
MIVWWLIYSKSMFMPILGLQELTSQRYYSHHHVQFPLLQSPVEILESYRPCPILFWIVMALALKGHEKYAHLYPQLRDPIKRLAADFTTPASRSTSFIHALLLLCIWPFPFSAVNEDPSWLYCGLAIHMAMLLGLHRPQPPFKLLNAADAEVGDLTVRTRTWLACFIVHQM